MSETGKVPHLELSRNSGSFIRVASRDEADRILFRNLIGINTDEDHQRSLNKYLDQRCWWKQDYWKEQGQPVEQVDIKLDEKKVTIYNFSKEKSLTDQHLNQVRSTLIALAQHFPISLDQLSYILIRSGVQNSAWGDNVRFPNNGSAFDLEKMLSLSEMALELFPHRIQAASNWEGTVAHETGHLIEKFFRKNGEGFTWPTWDINCESEPKRYIKRRSPDGTKDQYFDLVNSLYVPTGRLPSGPDQFVTDYARLNASEDFCDSLVAYLFDPELLKKISKGKYKSFEAQDRRRVDVPLVEINRIPGNLIGLPTNPEPLKYFVIENAT